MRKEYNDRWNAPLVNPAFTMAEYEASKEPKECACGEMDDASHGPFTNDCIPF